MKEWHIIVLLGLTVLLYARIFLKDPSDRTQQLNRDMEETISQFAHELEEENQQILDYILKMKNGYEAEMAKLEGRLEQLESFVKEWGETRAQAHDKGQLKMHPLTESAATYAQPVTRHVTAPLPLAQPKPTQPLPGNTTIDSEQPGQKQRTEETQTIEQRYPQLFQYYKEGKSVEWISKQIGIHIGEIQLILKLARQEEANRV